MVLIEGHAAIELSLNEEENLLNELNGVRSLQDVGVELIGCKLFLLVIEVSSVLSVGLLLLADLGELVVSNVELLALNVSTVKASSCEGCTVGLLEADEGAGRGLSIVSGQDLNALDLTELRELTLKLVLLVLRGEVLHEEVALLLGVLESLLLSLDNNLSLNGGQSGLHIELESIVLFVVEFLDSSLS